MKKYLVLGSNYKGRLRVDSNYKGVDRIDIPHDQSIDDCRLKEANESISLLMENRDLSVDGGEYLRDLDLALKIAQTFTNCSIDDVEYDVVQVVYPDEKPPVNMEFLGYDIINTNEYGSLIVNILTKNKKSKSDQVLIKALNQNFLCESIDHAEEICMSLKENSLSSHSIRILGLYKVGHMPNSTNPRCDGPLPER